MITVKAIVAMDEGRVIGVKNTIPWQIPEDMKRFAALTTGHAVLMGRKTYESLPKKYRPLPNRLNVVVTRKQLAFSPWKKKLVLVVPDPVEYLQNCQKADVALPSDELWVIGGEQIYQVTLPFCDELFLTRIHSKHVGDAFFPPFEEEFELLDRDARDGFSFERYIRKAL